MLRIFIKFVKVYSVMVRGKIGKNKGSGIIWPGLSSSFINCMTLIKVPLFVSVDISIKWG